MSEKLLQGRCDSRFEPVRSAFLENYNLGEEVGSSVAILVDGKVVVSLWSGSADQEGRRAWQENTLANGYSTTKGMAAICVHQLVEQGKLDLDAPVATYWPEFAAAGKETLPVRYLLSHQSGLPGFTEPMTNDDLYDWDKCVTALAAQKPWFEPGTRQAYQAYTYSWLVGELVKRVSGKSIGKYFHDHIAGPLGAEVWMGLKPAQFDQVADMSDPAPPPADIDTSAMASMMDPDSMLFKSMMNPRAMGTPGEVNRPEWRQAELAGYGGQMSALGIAKVYGALACGGELDGVHVLNADTILRARQEQTFKPDLDGGPRRWSLGFWLPQEGVVSYGPSENAFGHPGMGGSVGFADPDNRVSFGYVANKMEFTQSVGKRAGRLIEAFYSAL